jgi:hypothetical protein
MKQRADLVASEVYKVWRTLGEMGGAIREKPTIAAIKP